MTHGTIAEMEYDLTRGLKEFNIQSNHSIRANQYVKVYLFEDGSRLRINENANSIAFSDGEFYYAVRSLF